jgi:hypothetical protein
VLEGPGEPKGLNICTVFCVLTKFCGGKIMATLTVSIPDELKKKLERHPEINWSAYLKERFVLKLRQLKKFEELIDKGVI